MSKVLRRMEMHCPEGSFTDIRKLYEWLGRTRFSFHKFEIDVKIVEKKEEE